PRGPANRQPDGEGLDEDVAFFVPVALGDGDGEEVAPPPDDPAFSAARARVIAFCRSFCACPYAAKSPAASPVLAASIASCAACSACASVGLVVVPPPE